MRANGSLEGVGGSNLHFYTGGVMKVSKLNLYFARVTAKVKMTKSGTSGLIECGGLRSICLVTSRSSNRQWTLRRSRRSWVRLSSFGSFCIEVCRPTPENTTDHVALSRKVLWTTEAWWAPQGSTQPSSHTRAYEQGAPPLVLMRLPAETTQHYDSYESVRVQVWWRKCSRITLPFLRLVSMYSVKSSNNRNETSSMKKSG